MKKIMFSDKNGLTQAVLEGRKTQTRRIVPQSLIDKYEEWYDDVCCISMPSGSTIETLRDWLLRKHTIYRVGEVVAVAQSYEKCWMENASAFHNPYFLRGLPGWTNKMFVAAREMPHQIRITDVRVERLQDISEDDCLREGIIHAYTTRDGIKIYHTPHVNRDYDLSTYDVKEAFAHLINKVSRKDVWSLNPYVFVYDFELVK